MQKAYKDIAAGSATVVISAIMFALTFSFRRLTVSRIGPEFVPRIVFSILIILGAVLAYQGLTALRGLNCIKQAPHDAVERGIPTVLLTLLLIFLYIFLLDQVGFLIITMVYLFAQFIVLSPKGNRNYGLFAAIAVLSSTTVYFLFLKVFHLILPAGIVK